MSRGQRYVISNLIAFSLILKSFNGQSSRGQIPPLPVPGLNRVNAAIIRRSCKLNRLIYDVLSFHRHLSSNKISELPKGVFDDLYMLILYVTTDAIWRR